MKGALSRDELIKQADKSIARVIEENPYLTPWGFVSKKDLEKTLPQDLLHPEYVKAFIECYTWLSCITEAKNISTYRSSYGLKHVLENLIGMYVPNGAFITAALALKMPYKLRLGKIK